MRRVPLAFILSLLVAAPLAAQQTTAIPLLINHLVSDPVSGKLYGSVPSSAGANGNSIAVINPVTASVEQYLPIGAEPYRLAVSDDGQYLYVGLNGEFAVVPVHLPTLAVGTRFALGSFVARDIDVMPGSPQTVAVVLSDAEMHYGGNTVVYDNGTPRSTAGCDAMHIAFVPDGTGIFAARYGSQDRTYSLRRCDVTAAGVVNETTIHQDVYYGDAVASGNLLFATTGRVLDMTTRDPVAHLDRAAMYAVAPAVSRGLAYFATTAGTTTGEGTITALDLSTKRFAFAYPTPGLQFAQPRGLVTWGTDGLAYWTAGTATTAGAVYVTSLAATATLAVAKQGTGFGSITSSPARIFCGSEFSRFCSALFPADASVTLTATPDATSRFVGWQGDADCADGVVTMSAARTCTAVFAASMPRPLTALPFATNDLVYASSIGRILASIPADDPVWGNAIVAIDPATGEIGHSVWVGSQPNRLALSEDESVLYVGLDGQAAVISVSLPAFTAGTPFQLGFSSTPEPYLAADLAVISGSPSSVAVLRAAATLATTYSPVLGSVGVYDNGVRRPNVTSDGSASWIAASPAATRVYGVELPEQGAKFVRFNIDANGVTLLDRTDGLIGRSPIVQASGRVFAETGEAIDPEALTRLGTFPVLGGLGVAPDPASGLVYFLDRSSNIRVFDTEQFTPRQSLKTRWLEPPPGWRSSAPGAWRTAYRLTRWASCNCPRAPSSTTSTSTAAPTSSGTIGRLARCSCGTWTAASL